MKQFFSAVFLFGTIFFNANAQNVGIGTNTPSNKLDVRNTVTSSFNATIYGLNQGSVGTGIMGVSNALGTFGIQGNSTSGTGVFGSSTDYRAIYGSTTSGTALYGYSSDGYGLQSVGKVKISGGNTNPSLGAILTSDASGNAIWKQYTQVGFKAGLPTFSQSLPDKTYVALNFSEIYDNAGAFNNSSAAVNPNTFIAPVSGFYHFECSAYVYQNSLTFNIEETSCLFVVNGNPDAANRHYNYGVKAGVALSGGSIEAFESFHLNAGDKVKLLLLQDSGGGITGTAASCIFSGHLIFAD